MAANCSHFSAMSGSPTHEREYNTPWLKSSTVAIFDHFTFRSHTCSKQLLSRPQTLWDETKTVDTRPSFPALALIFPDGLGTKLGTHDCSLIMCKLYMYSYIFEKAVH